MFILVRLQMETIMGCHASVEAGFAIINDDLFAKHPPIFEAHLREEMRKLDRDVPPGKAGIRQIRFDNEDNDLLENETFHVMKLPIEEDKPTKILRDLARTVVMEHIKRLTHNSYMPYEASLN